MARLHFNYIYWYAILQLFLYTLINLTLFKDLLQCFSVVNSKLIQQKSRANQDKTTNVIKIF